MTYKLHVLALAAAVPSISLNSASVIVTTCVSKHVIFVFTVCPGLDCGPIVWADTDTGAVLTQARAGPDLEVRLQKTVPSSDKTPHSQFYVLH